MAHGCPDLALRRLRGFRGGRILLAVRDPRDVLLSCFQQRFAMNAAMFQLLKLDTASAYYDRVMGLGRASREKFPLRLHEVRYEALIDAFDPTVRELLDFLRVPWDDAVLNYTNTASKRTIGTPSAAQVVRPIYSSSRGRWRNYKGFLEPELPRLERWVAAFGYEPSQPHTIAADC